MVFRLEGKVALITAAGQGIGAASARIMAQQGAAVVIADINQDTAAAVADAICRAGGRASSVGIDARNEESVRDAINHTHRLHGRLDILHNNAGGTDVKRDLYSVDMPQAVWDEAFAWNFGSVQWG